MNLVDEQLSIERAKPRSLAVSFSYRASRLGRRIAGEKRALRFLLNSSRMLWQFAFELSGEVYDKAFHNQTKALNEEMLGRWIPPGGTFIDIGCGSGRWCQVAANYASRVVGIDSDGAELDRAIRESTKENVEYILGDFREFPRTHRFDLALLAHVIEHIDEPVSLLRDVREIADKLIVEVPDFESDPLNWVRLRLGCPFYTDADHVREYTAEMLERQVEASGWRIVERRKNGGSVLVAAEKI